MGITLNRGQEKIRQEAVDWYNNSSEQLFEIAGEAGTGKSVLMFEILKSLKINPNKIMPMAYTGSAANVMRSRGFKTARSIHSSLYEVVEVQDNYASEKFGVAKVHKEFRPRAEIDPNIDLFFIDEAYMVPESMKKVIMSFGRKVIVCGDDGQLPPVKDDPGFLTGYGIHYLTELMRQASNNPIIYIAKRARNGLPIHNGMYGNQVLVLNDDEFCPEMIGYADSICCGTNRTRDILNNYVRQLAGYNSKIPILGERIICRNNNWEAVQNGIALTNGLCGTVTSFPDPSSFSGKDVFTLNFMPDLSNNTVFYNVPINYEYFIAPFDEKQSMKEFSNRKYTKGELFEYAYALTTHLMQGSEYNKGIYIEEFMRPQIQNQLNYTGITRFKQSLIYLKKKNRYVYIPNKIFNQ